MALGFAAGGVLGAAAGMPQTASGLFVPISITFLNSLGLERAQFVPTISSFFIGLGLVQHSDSRRLRDADTVDGPACGDSLRHIGENVAVRGFGFDRKAGPDGACADQRDADPAVFLSEGFYKSSGVRRWH